MPNYAMTVIYKLCCNDTNITDIYVGSTCNFTMRKWQHKSSCNNPNSQVYNLKVYQFIREHGGWQNWSMVMVDEQVLETKLQKERLERQFIDELKPSLNSCIPTRTRKEYYEVNKDNITEWNSQKHDCICGSKYRTGDKSRHLKTKKHQDFIKNHQ